MKFVNCLAGLILVFAAGCSTFNYEWRREARKATPTNEITGRWEGEWISKTSGHHDPLRCLITPEGDGKYAARFRATYERVLHFSYTVHLAAQQGTNGVQFQGSANLGKLAGGLYQYAGYASPTNFYSTYTSKHDRGTFVMHRPPGP